MDSSFSPEIDQELNAALDIVQAMEITLKWALRETGDQAGFIGLYENGRINVMASHGYTYELPAENRMLMPDELPAAPVAITSLKTAFVTDTAGTGMLLKAQSQLATPILHNEKVIALLILENKTPKSWRETDLMYLNRLSHHAGMAITIAQLYAAVQAAEQAKNRFISFVSQELKIPITAVKGYADLLLAGGFGEITEMQARFLHTIRASVDRMTRLVSDLVDIPHIESGHLLLEVAAYSLPEIIQEVVRASRRQIEDKALVLTVAVPDELPVVNGDRSRMAQIMANLLGNAIKYTPKNGRITIQAGEISETIAGQTPRPMVQVSVTDTGLGISPKDQPGTLEKLSWMDYPVARSATGPDLRMSITKSLVEMHNGRFWFESEYRKGTTYFFTLPVATREI